MTHADLIDRIKAGSGPDRTIDRDVAEAVGYAVNVIKVPVGHPVFKEGGGLEFMSKNGGPNVGIPPWTVSLDACIGLMKEVLPGWEWEKFRDNTILLREPIDVVHWKTYDHAGRHEDLPRSILIAILQAMGEAG